MKVEFGKPPEWLEQGSITIGLLELQPHAAEALIENLREILAEDDDRVRLLLRVWDVLTGDD